MALRAGCSGNTVDVRSSEQRRGNIIRILGLSRAHTKSIPQQVKGSKLQCRSSTFRVSALGSRHPVAWRPEVPLTQNKGVCRASGDGPNPTESNASELSAAAYTSEEPKEEETTTPVQDTLSNLDKLLDIQEEGEVKKTVNNLNAILGIEDEVKDETSQLSRGDESKISVGIAPEALEKILKADGENLDKDKMDKMIDAVQKRDENGSSKVENAEDILKEFESLVDLMTPESIPKEDIEKMKSKVFGYNTYWVTSDGPNPALAEGGWIFRGNLRAEMDVVYKSVKAALESEFGDKYQVLMAEEVDYDEDAPIDGTRRVSFVVMLASLNQTPPLSLWQYGAGFFLFLLTAGSAVQLGLVAQVSKLPPETVEFFSKPENRDLVDGGDVIPPGLENFDPIPFFDSALPITAVVLACAGLHELGHFVLAYMRGVKLSPPFFIPNGQLGTFGAITLFRDRTPDRSSLFDIAAAGPVAGGSLAAGIFLAGLVLSSQGGSDLVPVPSLLLDGSLLLGGLTKLVLQVEPSANSTVLVHPMLIAGWCALTTTALNCLPVGSLDGGRIVQSAFGRRALALTGLLTYLGLALGVIGSALSLPFGLYILLTQRSNERPPFDDVSPVNSNRVSLALGLVLFSLLTLLPYVSQSTDMMNGMPPL